jgi:hypothetical protein
MMSRCVKLNGIVLCAALASACAQVKGPDPEPSPGPGGELNAVSVRDTLPAELVALRDEGLALRGERVVFDGEFDVPPKLKGVPATSDLRLDIVPGARLSRAESLQSMRSMALANPRVSAALGERYALLRSGWLDDEKDAVAGSGERYQLTFYSYARNEVVTVVTGRGREVIEVQSQAAQAQPAESREEVDAAVEIVRRDERFGPMVKDLRGRGILTPGPGRDRSLYLMFYRAARTPALFEATVNMSTGKVVDARPLR